MKLRRLVCAVVLVLLTLGIYKQQIAINELQSQIYHRCSWRLPDLISRVSPSVVYIEAMADYRDWSGSGVIIGPHTILTARHVIEEANSLVVTDVDGIIHRAIYWRVDPNNDCGVLIFEEKLGPIAKFANLDKIRVGDKVIIVGSPYGYDFFNTATAGIISGINREVSYFCEDLIITSDAGSWPGNSGGPVFNMQGQIVGILVGGHWDTDSFGIIVSADTCKEFYEEVK